jgi:predicted dehydrogenase
MQSLRPNRREFLGIVGGLATSAIATRAWAAQDGPADRVRIGVVGGSFGAGFHWHEDPGCEVYGVSDLLEDRLQNLVNRYQCERTYPSLQAMVDDDAIDAIAVFTGGPDHVRHAVDAMDAGKHVISAVPAAISLEGCAELIEAKERNGVYYMMAETSYYRWPCITARRMFADGAFGTLKYVEGEYYHPAIGTDSNDLSRMPEREGGMPTWRYGFPPMLYPTHATGFLVGVTGERLVDVSCIGTEGEDVGFEQNAYGNPFDNNVALFTTSSGNIFRCNIMWNAWNHGERAQWFGDRLSMFMSAWSGQPYVVKPAGQPDVTESPDYWHLVPEAMRYDSGHGASHPFITHEFITAILEDREPAIDVYESVAMTAPGIVAQESALRGGEHLAVPDFDPS